MEPKMTIKQCSQELSIINALYRMGCISLYNGKLECYRIFDNFKKADK